MSSELVPYSDLERMAETIVKAGLFPGIKTPQQAMTLFLVAQAEGLHPMTAALRYNVIQGRPAMKSEAMLASFMDRGGTVDWTEYTDAAVTGVFTSKGVPNGVKVRWTMDDARKAGVTMNATYTKYPRQMLKARVASDGVRMADPAVNQGRYTPQEVQDFEPQTVAADATVEAYDAKCPALEAHEADRDLTPLLEQSIAELKKPIRCKECHEETAIYKSTQEKHLGREYRQCKWAHDTIMDDMAQGVPAKDAHAAVSKHTREWLGSPPRKVPATKGAAPEASDGPITEAKPTEPAPSMFDPEAIAADVAARLAKECT